MARLECIRNEEIRHRLQQKSALEVMKEKRESWRVKVIEKLGSSTNGHMHQLSSVVT